jgi:signal peptidase I
MNLPTRHNQPQRWGKRLSPSPSACGAVRLRGFNASAMASAAFHPVPTLIHQVFMFVLLVCLSFLSYYFVSRYVVNVVVVQGRSMMPTLKEGDRLLLNRLAYHYRRPQRDEVVVIRDPGHADCAVKRIVGLPHEMIQFRQGEVYVNGKKRVEPFLYPGTRTYGTAVREMIVMLGENRYLVLGDNRGNSEDSRTYGPIRRDQIVGVIAR